jgi:hypothetical protein
VAGLFVLDHAQVKYRCRGHSCVGCPVSRARSLPLGEVQ